MFKMLSKYGYVELVGDHYEIQNAKGERLLISSKLPLKVARRLAIDFTR